MKKLETCDLKSLPGVGPATANKLSAAGFTTPESICVTPPTEIAEKSGIGFNTVLNIVAATREKLGIDFITAEDLWKKRQHMKRCLVGSENLNRLMGGGFETQAMTELIGEYGVGKTQICLSLCVRVQLPEEQGGLSGKVVYIDTEGTFIPDRVYQIAESLGLDPHETLNNIFLARAYNSSHQELLIQHLFKFVPENNVKLIVVDSMIGHFRGEYVGRENLSERQQKLNAQLHKLLRVTEAYNVAVIITNQVQANPTAFFGDPNRPAGGNVMAHASTHRVYLRKGGKGSRIATVIDSPYLPEEKARFKITEKGVEDTEEED